MSDPRRIDMTQLGYRFMHGIQRYYTRQDVYSHESGLVQLVRRNQFEPFHDLRKAIRAG